MALQLAVSTRNGRLDAIETDIGTDPTLKLRSGAQPADCATADSGTVISTIALPTDWMAAASGGTKAKSGTWQDASADASGTIAHFRIYTSGGICKLQGSVTLTGGGGDMTLDNTSAGVGQQITITSFTLTDGNA